MLLIGETGTGKELFAHAVHNASPRAGGAFVAINCAAMPENLLESELFGYEEGPSPGPEGGKPGLFEFAHGGTLFLDEVEGMSTALQCKLLRVLQEREIMRVGGNRIISVDVRIVAATNEDLERRVEEGSFRRDLYYRLNTLPVLIPPCGSGREICCCSSTTSAATLGPPSPSRPSWSGSCWPTSGGATSGSCAMW